MKNQVVLQGPHRYAANRMYEVPGANIVYAGTDQSCTADELAAAIGPDTAAVGYEVRPTDHPDWTDGTLSIEDAVRVAHATGVPVIADAASRSDPPDYMRHNAHLGRPRVLRRQVLRRPEQRRLRLREARPGGGRRGPQLHLRRPRRGT